MTCTTQEMSDIFNLNRQLGKQLRKRTLLNIQYNILHFMSQVVRKVLKRYKCGQFLHGFGLKIRLLSGLPPTSNWFNESQNNFHTNYCLHQHILVWSGASRARSMQWLAFLLFEFCSSLFRVLMTNYTHAHRRI